ncbi:gamma-glutamyl-gamma-aminobutyrate hydrolase family protein [Bacillota bacterium Lsc_1132]
MAKPMIGVLPLYDEEKASYWMLPGYMRGIEEAGGIPVVLPLTTDKEVILSILMTFDGFLFTGGQDVNPHLYGEKAENVCGRPCDERDQMEATLFQQAIALDKPVFGICRGVQLFNVLLGGTLYQDLPSQFPSEIIHKQNPPYDQPVHMVSIEKESPLYSIAKVEFLPVNSYHHQGIKKLSDQLVCAAKADDGLIEAVYMPGKRFVLAVQWHPEYMYQSDKISLRLFKELVLKSGSWAGIKG